MLYDDLITAGTRARFVFPSKDQGTEHPKENH